MSRDPIEERGGINLVVSVRNRPIDSIDILGNSAVRATYVGNFSDGKVNTPLLKHANAITSPDTMPMLQSINTAPGCIGVIGRLSITIHGAVDIDWGQRLDDKFGLTTLEHEMHHERIFESFWNYAIEQANKMEGCYCSTQCMAIAHDVVAQFAKIFTHGSAAQNAAFDLADYGYRLSEKERKIFENLKENSIIEYNEAVNRLHRLELEWKMARCRKK